MVVCLLILVSFSFQLLVKHNRPVEKNLHFKIVFEEQPRHESYLSLQAVKKLSTVSWEKVYLNFVLANLNHFIQKRE